MTGPGPVVSPCDTASHGQLCKALALVVQWGRREAKMWEAIFVALVASSLFEGVGRASRAVRSSTPRRRRRRSGGGGGWWNGDGSSGA